VAWCGSILFILIKGSLMNQIGFDSLDIDLVSILIGCLLSAGGHVGVAVFALGLGLLTDIFSAGWPGLSALLYMVVFLSIQLGSKFFDLHSSRGLLILIFLTVFVKGLLCMGMLMMLSPRIVPSSSAFSALAVSALATALLAPPVYYAISSFTGSFTKEADSAG
jgi:rod shape-determining protein MreD